MPNERWRFPIAVQAVTATFAVVNMAVIKVLFVDAFGYPLMALAAVLAILLAGRPSSVTLSTAHGMVEMRAGFIRQRIPLQQISSAVVKRTGITITAVGGRQVSLCTNWLVGWLRLRTPAHQIISAVNRAIEDAREAREREGRPYHPAGPVVRGTRSNRAMLGLAAIGFVAIVAAFLVRFSWPNPVLTVLAVMFAVYIGLTGAFMVIFAVWIMSAERGPSRS
jgi:hypothetical protein